MRWMIITGILAAGIMLSSCGGSGAPSSGSVALFVTDDMSGHREMITTINRVQIVKPGTAGSTCELLSKPVTLNISNLSSVIHLLDVSNCSADSYATIHVEFQKSVQVMDEGNVSASCSFASFKDSHGLVNTLNCDGENCSMDISGSFNVFAGSNALALDFNLQEFEVNDFPSASCTVGMKVSTLDPPGIDVKKRNGYREALTGYVSGLNPSAKTFVLGAGTNTFSVNYSGVSRQNIDQLLQFALANNLKVNVESSGIGTSSFTCSASALFVKLTGTVSDLDISKNTFLLTYQKDRTLSADYSEAAANNRVEGQLDKGVNVEVKLDGFNGTNYSAYQVEVGDIETEN